MKILLADDHALFVEGLQNLLQAGGYEVVGAAENGLAALQLARQLHPDLILMDVRMPDCDGLEATRLIHAELPEVRIVMLTTSSEDTDLFEALKSGASGYLLKNLKPNELFTYLEGFARGEVPLSPGLSARLLHEFTRQAAALEEQVQMTDKGGHPPNRTGNRDRQKPGGTGDESNENLEEPELTLRQRQILEMIAEGATYKEVGASLHVSENTVKYHMGEVLQRLHLKNREQVVAYALRTGMIKS